MHFVGFSSKCRASNKAILLAILENSKQNQGTSMTPEISWKFLPSDKAILLAFLGNFEQTQGTLLACGNFERNWQALCWLLLEI